MQVGDLVRHSLTHSGVGMIGIIIERVHDPLAMSNDVFNVLLQNGLVAHNVWDYDLEEDNESW